MYADTLLEVFKQYSEVRSNMHVVSNRLIFDEEEIAVGHSEPLVHSYNKGKSPEQLAEVAPFIEVHYGFVCLLDCAHYLSLSLTG